MRRALNRPALCLLAVVASTLLSGAANPRATRRQAGAVFTTRVTTVTRDDGSTGEPASTSTRGYTGVTISAAGRSRMDILDGGEPPVFTRGYYVLSDTAGFIVVRPAAKDFFFMPSEIGSRVMELAQSSGMSLTIKDVAVKLDTLTDGVPIEGFPTRHLRMTGSFNVIMDMSGMSIDTSTLSTTLLSSTLKPTMTTRITMDYWIADLSTLPAPINPAQLFGTYLDGGAMHRLSEEGDLMKEFADKMSATLKGLPRGMPLKTVVATRITTPSGGVIGTDVTTEIGAIKGADVDLDRLTLPDDYTEVLLPGQEDFVMPPSADDGSRWRVRPGG